MWQMTWDELDQDKVKPRAELKQSGSTYYTCGICGNLVGLFGPEHEHRWLYKVDKCQNGHVVDWTGIQIQ